MVIAAVGKNASGKDYFLEFISKEFGVPMLSVGDVARELAEAEGLEKTRENLHYISKKYMSNQAFCPHCGHKYNPCPKCGSDNADTAKRCVSCGTQLMGGAQAGSSSFCQGCGAPLAPGARFCANCGTRAAMADDKRCTRCGFNCNKYRYENTNR